MQVNPILAKFMGNNEKIAIIIIFVYSSFNCCPLVWHFCSCESSHKIGKIQKRCLRIVLGDCDKKNGTTGMEIKIIFPL